MKIQNNRLALVLALGALALLPAWAHEHGYHHMDTGHHYMDMAGRHYRASAEVTLKGTVAEVKAVDCDVCGPAMGTHLVLKSGTESTEIMLGPATFLEKQDFAIANGDEIEVTGAKIGMGDQTELIAREVKKGDKTLTLRDKTGRPMWAGRGAR